MDTKIKRDELVKALTEGPVAITYRKLSDGDNVHTINGSLSTDTFTSYSESTGDKRNTSTDISEDVNSDVVKFIDVDRKVWRSVRVDKIVSYA